MGYKSKGMSRLVKVYIHGLTAEVRLAEMELVLFLSSSLHICIMTTWLHLRNDPENWRSDSEFTDRAQRFCSVGPVAAV